MHIESFQYLQILCLIIAIICYQGLKDFSISLFIPLLFLDCAADLLGDNYTAFGWSNNYFLYNYYLIVITPLTFLLFSKMLDLSGRSRVIYFACSALCMSFILINNLFFQGREQFNTYTLLVVMIINVTLSSLVLIKLVMDESQTSSLLREPYFWINVATLFFSLGTLITLGLQNYIVANNLKISGEYLGNFIMHWLNVFLYCALSYGFILCLIHKHKLSLQ